MSKHLTFKNMTVTFYFIVCCVSCYFLFLTFNDKFKLDYSDSFVRKGEFLKETTKWSRNFIYFKLITQIEKDNFSHYEATQFQNTHAEALKNEMSSNYKKSEEFTDIQRNKGVLLQRKV